jgi:F0F1-type ATP synthase membrane subunit b/b'
MSLEFDNELLDKETDLLNERDNLKEQLNEVISKLSVIDERKELARKELKIKQTQFYDSVKNTGVLNDGF